MATHLSCLRRPLATRATLMALPVLAVPVLAIAGATGAAAGGFGLREQSAYYQGYSFAGTAAGGDGLASMFWNPAALSFSPGLNMEANVTWIAPHASIDVYRATGPLFGNNLGNVGIGDIVDDGAVPATYITYAWDRIAVGLAVNAPFGLITDAPCNWSGRYYGCYSRIFDMNIQGSIAYKVNDWLTLGAGFNVNYIDARLSNAQILSAAPLTFGAAQVDGDSIGYGINLGALLTLAPGTTVGLGYRSQIDQGLSGTITPLILNNPVAKLPAQAGLTLPDQATLSLRSKLTPNFTVLGTVEWTNWSTVQELKVESIAAPDSVLNLQWKDGWFFSGGVEYQWDPKLALRAGLAYELTPVPDATRSPRLPDTNRLWLSAGFTYAVTEKLALDVAYTHIFGEDAPIALFPTEPANALRGSLVGSVNDGYVDIVSLALRYKFDSPVSAAPVYTK
ncbi:transporter [Xanthobacter tagetidis]|uniref:Transporter n=2 Tax=Xanthobacter tagetidis TaxID=60216 RepID=A0A3L7AM16_9HYPH|nr:transporter [Xanthobacter tagetidis]